jgi:hypothetical protein
LVIDGDQGYPAPFKQWLVDQGLSGIIGAGWGEVLWMERGRLVGQALNYRTVTHDELVRRATELWVHPRT